MPARPSSTGLDLTPEQQFELLSRGTEEILPAGELLERLRLRAREGKPLRVKQGFDPTAPDLHLGHSVGLRKLRQFQDLGHQIVLIVGDYTGMVGDPSGLSKTRPRLTEAEVEAHARTYLDQFHRVLDPSPASPRLPVEVHRNGEWFSRMSFADVMRLASEYTLARLLERDDFAKRFGARQPISIHELFYPLMQGYDSVAIRSDVELGGTEQKFNLLVGRTLQEVHGQPPQIILTVPLLTGLDGVQRMSKSLGNYIGVTDAPSDMYGKIMSLPDHAMDLYWRLSTDASPDELREVAAALANPAFNPMTIKKRLARRIVAMYHGDAAGERAERDFEVQFSKRGVPEDIPELGRRDIEKAMPTGQKAQTTVDLAVATGIPESRSAARRLIDQKAMRLDGEIVERWDQSIDLDSEHVIKLGRQMRRYRPNA
jgi:tyrosyl-tRNA synthetase